MKAKVLYGFLVVLMLSMVGQSVHGEGQLFYYNPNGGRYLHCEKECKTIRSMYHSEMIELTEEELADEQYAQLQKCNICFKDGLANGIPSGTTKFYYRSVYDTGDDNAQYTAGNYHAGISIMPGIYTAKSDSLCDGALMIFSKDTKQLASYEFKGESSVTFYLGNEMSVAVPENCILHKVVYSPGFQKAHQRTTVRYGRYITMLEIPGAKYCVESIPGESGYYVLSTIQGEIGNEPMTVVEVPEGETVELNLQGAYDVFVEFVNCIVWPSEQGEG